MADWNANPVSRPFEIQLTDSVEGRAANWKLLFVVHDLFEMNPADEFVMHRECSSAERCEFDDFFGPNIRLEGVWARGVLIRPGDVVRLRPKGRAAMIECKHDGKVAVVETIEEDLDQRVQLTVRLAPDGEQSAGESRRSLERFLCNVSEVEPLAHQLEICGTLQSPKRN